MITYRFIAEKRMAVAEDNGENIAKCTYLDRGTYWEITHTYVNPDYRGQKIAEKIVNIVIEEARKAGKKIKPVCSYANNYMTNKPEFEDVLLVE